MPPQNPSIQAFFPPNPSTSPPKSLPQTSPPPVGDGFTPTELESALQPATPKTWHPPTEYTEHAIRDLYPGPQAVTFMGRVANIFDVTNAPKTPRSAKGCVKLCVKDDSGAVTVRVWWATRYPKVRLGSLVSVWANHGETFLPSLCWRGTDDDGCWQRICLVGQRRCLRRCFRRGIAVVI
jgi:hypothetical protein